MIVLPDGEEILDVICGDKDFWVISATQNIAHVKPAKEGAATNLNLVTGSGAVYSFLLTEKNGRHAGSEGVRERATKARPPGSRSTTAPRRSRRCEAELPQARAAVEAAGRRADEAIAAYQQQYPARLQFAYGTSEVREAVPRPVHLARRPVHLHQGRRQELPALYEVKDGKPALVNFQVQQGTYVVPKVLDEGYLALGKERFAFAQQER